MLHRYRAALALLVILPAGPVLAQGEPIHLPQVIISATALPTLAEQIGSSVTVITAEEIERDQRRTVPEILAAVPGLNIVNSGPSGPTSVFMRGTNSNHVKVLIDGIEMNDPSSPNRAFDFSALSTFDIDRIEVLRGPQSGLYGADAFGGVISITTKRGAGPASTSAFVEGGSYGTFNQAAQVSGGTDRSHFALTATHLRSDSVPVTPKELLPPGQSRNNDFYENWTYHTKLGADLTENFSVNFVGRYTDIRTRFTEDDFLAVPPAPRPDQSKANGKYFYGLGEAAWKLLDGRINHRAGFAYTDISRRNFTPGGTWRPFDGKRHRFYWQSDTELTPDHTFLLGAEHSEEAARTNAFSASANNTGVYAELQSGFSERFFVVSNIRHDNHETFGGHTTWRIASAFLIPETGTKLKATYGTAFYAPSLNELFDDSFGTANPDLKPEESKGFDIGFEQSLFQNRVTAGATWFQNDIKNLITFVAFASPFENVDRARTHGVEGFIAAQITDHLRLRTDYTYTIAKNADTGDFLLRRPKHKVSVNAVWQPSDKFTLSATALWVSGWHDFERLGGPIKTSDYTVVNLAANYRINERVTLFGRIDNLFNEKYQVPDGFLRPGLSAYAGLRVAN